MGKCQHENSHLSIDTHKSSIRLHLFKEFQAKIDLRKSTLPRGKLRYDVTQRSSHLVAAWQRKSSVWINPTMQVLSGITGSWQFRDGSAGLSGEGPQRSHKYMKLPAQTTGPSIIVVTSSGSAIRASQSSVEKKS